MVLLLMTITNKLYEGNNVSLAPAPQVKRFGMFFAAVWHIFELEQIDFLVPKQEL
jgi:hypothetical protein